MLKSEKFLLATTALVTTIAGGTFLLSLKVEQQKEVAAYVEPIVDRNPMAPLLVDLNRPAEANIELPKIDVPEEHSAREVLKNVVAHIPTPPHKPKFKQAYQAIAAHFRTEKPAEEQKPQEALAYAAQENPIERLFGVVRQMAMPSSTIQPQPGLAVYKISDHKVYLPTGEKLEAHSGLGHMRDNPQYVHVKMRGPTPPHIYDLSWRESLFHGVKAVRLNPVGGAKSIWNRDGLLAHTYMLNPEGASNGCISIRDYDAFKQAFANGIIKRVAVVP